MVERCGRPLRSPDTSNRVCSCECTNTLWRPGFRCRSVATQAGEDSGTATATCFSRIQTSVWLYISLQILLYTAVRECGAGSFTRGR